MKNYLKLLNEEWSYFQMAEEQLDYSHLQLQKVSLEVDFSDEELVQMEAYTARFARVLDIYTQKILKTIDILEGYGDGSLRDILNRCEKSGIISNANKVLTWRILRNEIAHDYIPNQQRKVFFEVREHYAGLLDSIAKTRHHINSAGWLNG
jgi:hypothetical protein